VLVAIGTALPEAAAAVAAARRGQGDIVAGHVIGSSLFNLLVVLGGMAAIGGTLAVPASFVRLELPIAFLFALLLVPLLRGNTTVSRGEGALLLAALVAWLVLEFALLGCAARAGGGPPGRGSAALVGPAVRARRRRGVHG